MATDFTTLGFCSTPYFNTGSVLAFSLCNPNLLDKIDFMQNI